MIMSEYTLHLLAIGINNGGFIRAEDAYGVYGNRETARSALIRLMNWGYIKPQGTPGIFSVKKAPPEAFEVAKNLK